MDIIESNITNEIFSSNIFNQAPVAIVIFRGENFLIEFANDFYLQILGKSSHIIGKPLFESFPELKNQGLKEILDGILQTGIPYNINEHEFVVERNNTKEKLFFNCAYQPLRENDNIITGIIVVFSEVTEQITARRLVEDSEKRYSNMFMKSPFAFAIMKGKNMVVALANESIKEIWGKGDNIIGKGLFEILPEVITQGFPKIIDEVYATGVPFYGYEMQVNMQRNQKLEECYFNFVYQPYHEADHTISGIVLIAYEVTEQVLVKKAIAESEEKFRSMTDLMPVKVSYGDANGKTNYFNERWIEYTGLNLDELIAFGWDKIVHPEDKKISDKNWVNALKNGTNFEMEIRILEKNKKYHWHLSRVKPIIEINGKISHWIGINTEIHNQKTQNETLEEAIKVSTQELIIANKELSFQDNQKLKRANELIIKNNQLLDAQVLGQFGSWDWDIINDKIEWSQELYRIFGIEPNKFEFNFDNFLKNIHPDDSDAVKKTIDNAIKDRKPFTIYHRIVLPNGKIREIKGTGKVYVNKKNEIIRMAGIAQDISDKKQAQKQAYSRSLIDSSLDPLFTISTKGKITDVNKATIRVTGIAEKDLIGSHFYNYFTEPTKAKKIYQEVFKKGFVNNYPLIIKDHHLTNVLFNGSVYKDENNAVLGAVVVARDITEQKIAEQNLLEYKHLFNENFDFACIANADGLFEVVNKSFENVLGYSQKELINNSFLDFLHPDDIAATIKEVEDLSHGHRTIHFVNRYMKKNGHYVTLDWKANFNKETNKIYALARDITEQKEAEQKLINSLQEITDYKYALDAATIVDITDEKGNLTYVNENFEKISKYSSKELIGSSHHFINSNYHSKEFMSDLWETISSGKIWKNEIRNKAKDGSFYWVNSTIVPFLNENGIPHQYIAISIDITAKKLAEQELVEAKVFAELAASIAEDSRRQAEESAKSKQQFLSNMSHEIRTPMNAIIGFTKVVLKTQLTAKQKEYLMAIKMSGDSLIVLINDILDLAKVDSGKMTFEKTPFKLALSITAMLHLFETKIQEKNLKLITEYDSKIPEVVLGDPIRLNQIILNLVSNAVKFTNKGTIKVSISLLSEDDEKVSVKFSVADTGIGIKTSKIGKIFENFQQATSTTSRLYGGTGLGLAIVKQLVEAQGGKIKIETQVNKGSTFSFVLNYQKTTIDAVHEPEIIQLDSAIKNTKILVVEDMELNQLLMKTLLDDFGYECDITANGKLAIEKLKTKTYDIILMDLQMPEMNGFQATEYIRKKMKSEIPIIALTADVTTVDVEKCKAVGMNDYIAKPVDERLLYSKLIAFSKKPVVIIEHTKEQDPAKDTIKYVDMSYLKKLTKANPKLMSQMINAYLEQTPPLIATMKKSMIDKDWKMLQSAVHKMIPSFSIMGISPDIQTIAKKIQEYVFTIEVTEEIHNLVLELEKVCTQACKELELELTNLKK